MRTVSSTHEAVLDSATRFANTLVRVSVKDSGGTFRDLTTYPEDNFVLDVTVRDDIDSNGPVASVTLQKAIEGKSLAPLMEVSPLNLAFNPSGSWSPLLALGRMVKIEVALLPEGKPVQSGDWFEFFRGYLDSIDFGEDTITIACRDQVKLLQDVWIEDERVYAFCQGANAVKGALVFKTGKFYALNTLVTPSNGKPNAHFYKVTTSGTTAATEPTWPTGGGSTVTSGTCTFTEVGATSASTATAVETVMQQIIDDNLGASVVTLYTPVSPAWNIRAFVQQRESTWDAIRALATQIGWDLRFKWRSGTAQFELTFYEPDRAKVTPDRTFDAGDEWKLTRLSANIHDIRNAIRLVWTDPTSLDAAGVGTRTETTYTAATSISTFGRRFMEIQESQTSNIDTGTEASDFASALLSDLALPKVDRAGVFEFFPFAELGDLYRFSADNINYSSNQDLAVISYEHRISATEATTSIQARGTPAGGYNRWLASVGAWTQEQIHRINPLLVTSASLAVSRTVGGQSMAVTAAEIRGNSPTKWEYHVSDGAGFTPSSSTLKNVSESRRVAVADLEPGRTYYGKAVPIFFNDNRIIRGLPTEEVSFTAYRAEANMLDGEVNWGRLPLNGGFETSTDGVGADHWTATGGGAWGAQATLRTDGACVSGLNYARLNAIFGGTTPAIESAYFNADDVEWWSFRCWYKVQAVGTGALGNFTASVAWYSESLSLIGSDTIVSKGITGTTGWLQQNFQMTAAAGRTGARYATIKLQCAIPGTSGTTSVDIDSVEAFSLGEPWFNPGDTMPDGTTAGSFANSWVDYGGSTSAVSFRKDKTGRVWLKGVMKDGTVASGTPAFTLPAGFRPSDNTYLAVDANGAHGTLEIQTDGDVCVMNGSNLSVSLDGLSFSTW